MSTSHKAPAAYDSIIEHIGATPLVRLNRLPQSLGIKAKVYGKCEFFNAGGSVKDRIARRMIEEAEREGRIKPGDTLIEPTSGNTGIGLALVAAVKGYRCIITLPEKMSSEKVSVLRALGAEIVRTPTEAAFDAPESHIGVAKRLQKEIPNSHILDQYGNVNNPLAHELGTAEEIWEQSQGKIDAIVAGAGTGGTITGIARGLKKHNPNVTVIAADPVGSILAMPESLNTSHEGYKVEGIGYDFVPDVLDQGIVNTWIKTNDKSSFQYSRRLIAEEGLLVGGSCGSAFSAMVEALLKTNPELNQEDKTVVIVFPDSVRNYMTKFLDDSWMMNNNFHANEPTPCKAPKIRDLNLKPVVAVTKNNTAEEAMDIMREKSFDQLPVLSDSNSKRLVGLVTLGNLLSYISRGRATAETKVAEVMFDFTKLHDVVSDPSEIGQLKKQQRRKFDEVTLDTPLDALGRFFEHNSAAVVTEREADGGMKVLHVVTKVDLLGYLVKAKKAETNGNAA
ncbi:tryptophan synthase beta subunit-like PLP-dependent enzyme [Pyronema domesticum]|uniref:Cystathionine beta-synthase n=1 Tax=Pyronema omphalodes (strain CBS 100304) TaxID=1076935 RepID=U4LSY8_PYROM|nr:tryptophan synthase beta subunit-like PLP-dependent enzyme [Pyronema domesticum]CCX32515.1 Similar to Cystathionine beta-synthase; acc. no. P46794 [Pyronema omphalodes CBS 100304]